MIQVLRTGDSRAGQELAGFGRTAEIPLVDLLREVKHTHQILDVLNVLKKIKISYPFSVDAVVRLLSHKQFLVRRAAAYCLLDSSPRLRQALGQIRAALKAEKDTTARAVLQKLLDRYPEKKASL